MLSNSFYKAIVTMAPTDIKSKKQNYKTISLMIHKIINKMCANQIQEHTKKYMYWEQLGFIWEMQGWFNICKWVNVIGN